MRKTIIKIISISIAVLATFAIFALPIFNIDTYYFEDKYANKIDELKEDMYFCALDHKFTLDTVQNKDGSIKENIVLGKEEKTATLSYQSTCEEDVQGVKFNKSFHFEIDDFDLVSEENETHYYCLSIWASGENSKLIVNVNGEEVTPEGGISLTNEMAKYEIITPNEEGADLKISFSSQTTLYRIKVNEKNAKTPEIEQEDAKASLLNNIIFFSGITNSVINYDHIKDRFISESDIPTEVNNALFGINFYDLFNMAIRDISYDFNVAKELISKDISSDLIDSVDIPLSATIDKYVEYRLCPFVSILVFISALAIIGSFAYMIVSFIIDLILKKQTTNTLIPSLVALGGLMIILNISTFFGPSFFDGSHNLATEYRIFLFEILSITPTFYVAIALVAILAVTNVVNFAIDLKELKTMDLQVKLTIQVIILITITVLMLAMTLVGIFVR